MHGDDRPAAIKALLYGEACKRLHLDEVLGSWGQEAFTDEVEEDQALDAVFEGLREEVQDEISQQDSGEEDDDISDLTESDLFASGSEDHEEEVNLDLEVDTVLQGFDYLSPDQINSRTMGKWQKQGPPGKLHNHGNCFHRSSQLVGALHDAQKAIHPEATTKEWVHNNATRWQSDEAMAARALELRQPLERLHRELQDQWEAAGSKPRDKPPVLDYRLGPEDWRVVEAIQKVLAPFKFASKQLQGDGPQGALIQYFPQMECLLLHLEDCAEGDCYFEREDPENSGGPRLQENVKIFKDVSPQRHRFLKAHIKVGLWKLQQYYDKLTSLAYAAAVIFNPALKLSGLQGIFDAEPQRQQPGWRDHYLNGLRKRWEENYKNRHVSAVEKSFVLYLVFEGRSLRRALRVR